MSVICPSCKTRLSCGCQMGTASNGARLCTSCIGGYEAELKRTKLQAASPILPPTPNTQAIYNPVK